MKYFIIAIVVTASLFTVFIIGLALPSKVIPYSVTWGGKYYAIKTPLPGDSMRLDFIRNPTETVSHKIDVRLEMTNGSPGEVPKDAFNSFHGTSTPVGCWTGLNVSGEYTCPTPSLPGKVSDETFCTYPPDGKHTTCEVFDKPTPSPSPFQPSAGYHGIYCYPGGDWNNPKTCPY